MISNAGLLELDPHSTEHKKPARQDEDHDDAHTHTQHGKMRIMMMHIHTHSTAR